ncbi:MAG: PAS domain S-box protein [candidate division KSB1 bacterium]|nr:PAS domain S-box protein [candidate division KSB1 bacterium]
MRVQECKIIVLSSRKTHEKCIKAIVTKHVDQLARVQIVHHLSLAVKKIVDESSLDAVFIHSPLYIRPRWKQPLEAISQKLNLPIVVFFDEPIAKVPHSQSPTMQLQLKLNDPHQQRQVMHRLFALINEKRSYQHAELRRKRYEKFFKDAPVMQVITQMENDLAIIIDHNEQFAQALDYDPKDILGKPLHHFFSESSLSQLVQNGNLFALEAQAQPAEYELVARNGRIIHALMHAMPELDVNRQVIGMWFIFVDITTRKTMEKELRRLSSIIEQTADHVMVTDINGIIQYVNPAFEALTGYSAEEVLGKHPRILKSGKHSDGFYRNLWQTILAGQIFREVVVNRKKNGELFYEEKTITPIKDEQGQILYFVSTAKDITDRVLLEERLQQMQKLEAVGRLTAGITHDFNHILALILSHAEDMLTQLSPGNVLRAQIEEIIKAAQAGANLTRKLLTFSKTQALEPSLFNLADNIKKMLNLLRPLIPKNISLSFEAKFDDICVYLDPAQIDQLILNFVINARDALPNGGEIIIALDRADLEQPLLIKDIEIPPGQYAVIRVTDNGIGMTEEIQKHIFEPFFSTKKGRSGNRARSFNQL